MTATEMVHCFERAGLGKAPFRFVGMIEQEIEYGQAVVGRIGGCAITTRPGGSCDYCGTAIRDMYGIQSADGRSFKVGCDCVLKTGDGGLINVVKDAKRQRDREKRIERDRQRRVAEFDRAVKFVAANRPLLENTPHPSAYNEDQTLAEYADWMIENRYIGQKFWSTLRAAGAK